tara:strand:+ start:225 stop:821 length:597 start_codon:yes stop_codon:yes gene_type:complete
MNYTVFPVYYNKKRIGIIVIKKMYKGVSAEFKIINHKPLSKILKVHCFNWIQKCIYDDNPPITLCDELTKVPYIDPLPGGFALQKNPNYIYWADHTLWYWDTKDIQTTNKKGMYSLQCTLNANYDGSILKFIDTPLLQKDSSIRFNTWLVGLNRDSSLNVGLIGFAWEVSRDSVGLYTVDIDENNLEAFTLDKVQSCV